MRHSTKLILVPCVATALLAGAPKAQAVVEFDKNIGTIFNGIGEAIEHVTAVRIHLSKEERENGIRPPGAPSGGPHGLFSIVFTINNIDKSLSPSNQFVFGGFVLPPTWPANAWAFHYVDPPGTGYLTLDANPAYGDAYLLKGPDDFLDFQFSWQGDPSAGISSGYPFSDSLRGVDQANFPDQFGITQTEDGFHPFFAPEPSHALMIASAACLGLMRRRQG